MKEIYIELEGGKNKAICFSLRKSNSITGHEEICG